MNSYISTLAREIAWRRRVTNYFLIHCWLRHFVVNLCHLLTFNGRSRRNLRLHWFKKWVGAERRQNIFFIKVINTADRYSASGISVGWISIRCRPGRFVSLEHINVSPTDHSNSRRLGLETYTQAGRQNSTWNEILNKRKT